MVIKAVVKNVFYPCLFELSRPVWSSGRSKRQTFHTYSRTGQTDHIHHNILIVDHVHPNLS